MDWNESGRQQLLLLCVVSCAGVEQLVNTDLNGTGGDKNISVMSRAEVHLTRFIACMSKKNKSIRPPLCNGTYLAEVVSVECQSGLWSQLEEMELGGENLLSRGYRGQVEPVLHLFAAHCNRM